MLVAIDRDCDIALGQLRSPAISQPPPVEREFTAI
jgi:hypothetical protein